MTDRPDLERSPRAWTARPGVRRACGRCGEQFALPWASARYCSPACRAKAEAASRLRAKIAKAERRRRRAAGRGRGSE